MLLQKARIGKTAVLVIILIILGLLAALPLFLRAEGTGEADRLQYLPLILNEADGTPNPPTEATATSTASATATATSTNTPVAPCDIAFDGQVYAGDDAVDITGDVGTEVTIINLSDGNAVLGSGTLAGPVPGHTCVGFASIPLSAPLNITNAGDILLAVDLENPDNNDTIIVFGMPTVTPSSTPIEPYLVAIPDCGPGPDIQFNLQGFNWPTDQSVTLFWEGTAQVVLQAGQHTGSFSFMWSFSGLSFGVYEVTAQSGIGGTTFTELVAIPCELLPTNTPAPTDTPASQPADLVVGQPQLISTPPIVVYQPLAFAVPITNTGDIDVNTLFFVDLLFDPLPVHIEDSYTAVSSLNGGSTVTLTITSTIGLANFIGDHQVTALVDSLDHVIEADETNNLSAPFEITISEPAMTPNYTPTPTGSSTISGIALVLLGGDVLPQERMHISAIEVATGEVVAVTYSDENGFYQFDNLIEGTSYTVQGCIMIDNNAYFGILTDTTPLDTFADIFAVQSASCP